MRKYVADRYRRVSQTNILSNFFNLSGIQFSNIVLALLIFPLITRKIGIEAFGYVTLANALAILSGVFINFGTNESGIRDVASNTQDPHKLGEVVFNIFWSRLVIFFVYMLLLFAFRSYFEQYFLFILLSTPMVAAEVLNPLYLYVGVEKLRLFNFTNLLGNILSVVNVILFIKSPANATWVNFILGMSTFIAYGYLFINGIIKFKLAVSIPTRSQLIGMAGQNIYLTANSASVQLQQSIMIFALGSNYGSAALLGAYSLCDKVIRSTRTMCITLSNSLYPRCVQIFNHNAAIWTLNRKQWKVTITVAFLFGSLLIFLLAAPIVKLLSKEENHTAIIFLRCMALVPAVSALNFLNVIDQLLKKRTVNIFRIAVILSVLSLVLTYVFFNIGNYILYGLFTLIIELCAWLMYEFAVKNTAVSHA